MDSNVPPMQRADPHFVWKPVEHTPSPSGLPTNIHLAAGNGGEYRKSYHGLAYPIAYVVASPQSVHVLPMQIGACARAPRTAHRALIRWANRTNRTLTAVPARA